MTIRDLKSLIGRPLRHLAVSGGVLLVTLLCTGISTAYAQTILPAALMATSSPAILPPPSTSQATSPTLSMEANLAPPAMEAPALAHPALAMPIASESTAPLPTSTTTTTTTTTDAPPPLTISTDTTPPPAPPTEALGRTASVDRPASSVMPLDPPPLPQESRLDNAIRNEAERSFYDAKKQKYQSTFERAYEGLVPLGPNEVRDTMSRYERTQRASVPPSTGQPRGQVRIKTLSLEPGSEPPTINISSGYVTTITILDATGEPWPILDLGIGGNFEVSKTGGGNHVIRVMPLTRFGYGNLSVLLQDLSTPIIFKLASGGATVDYRFDARVPRLGPNAKLSLIDKKNRLQAGSADIMGFLDNAPPPEAKRVRINGADSRTMAWTVDRRMFVRTPLTMLSPSWDSSVSSADGTTVYELTETPVLIMSDNGVLVRARVAPKEEE